MHSVVSGRTAMLALAITAGLTLLLGTAIYLTDRPAGSAWLIPAGWQAANANPWFGSAGLWLPSFVHAFAFSVLTAWVLPRRPAFAAAACLAWALVDSLAEIGQLPELAAPLSAALAAAFDGAPLAARVGRYFTQGSFDPADLAAGLAGSALAYLALHRFVLRTAAAWAAGPQRHLPPPSSNTRQGTPT